MSRSLLTSRMMSCCPIALRRGLHVSSLRLGIGTVRVHEHGNCCRLGHELAQQLQSLRPQHGVEKDHARDVAARPVEAGDEAVLDRVAPGREDDRYRRGCGLGRERRIAVPDDHGHRPANQFSHQSRQSIRAIFRRAKFDRDVLALDEAGFLQALAERGHEVRCGGERRAAEKPDHRHRRLLRMRAQAATTAAPPRSVMNSRRFILAPELRRQHLSG